MYSFLTLLLTLADEMFSNGFKYNSLNIITVISIACGILVIISKNPIVSVLFLIGLFVGIASYLMMLGMTFIGLSYLLVYVGAVSILFLFILMLINVRVSELVTDNNNSVPLGVFTVVTFNLALNKLLPYNLFDNNLNIINIKDVYTEDENTNILNIFYNIISPNKDISFVTSYVWDSVLAESSHITSIGNVIYTIYPMWLILTSIILLLAMVGTIVITIK